MESKQQVEDKVCAHSIVYAILSLLSFYMGNKSTLYFSIVELTFRNVIGTNLNCESVG